MQIASSGGGAAIEDGRAFWGGSSGRWAGERLMAALKAGRGMTPAELRTNDTLRKDEWIFLDTALVEEATIRLVGVADLIAANLVRPVANSMGKTVFEYEKVTDMEEASVSLDGMTRSEMDRVEFQLAGLPLPITHKDFFINLRTLEASRTRGEALDTTQVRVAGRLVSEKAEKMLFSGGKTFGGLTIYGYLTHPDRNIVAFGAGGAWTAVGKTGEQILNDVLSMIGAAEVDHMNGPYWLYVPRTTSVKLDADFKTYSDKSTRARLLEVAGIDGIKTADSLPADNIILVQHTMDVVAWVQGEPLQSIQWDVQGGFGINFKAFQIGVPLIRSDAAGQSGVVHMS